MVYSALAVWFALPLLSLFLLDFLSKKLSRLPPGPTPLPLVGNLHLVGSHPHLSLAKLAATYGPIMTLHLGRLTSIVISSAELAKEALQKNDQALAGRYVPDTVTAVGHHESTAVWLPPDVKWRRLRALYAKFIFSNQSLEATWGLRKKKVEELLACLSDASRAGEAVNFRQLVHATVNNIVSNIEFSADFVDIKSETAAEFQILSRDHNDEAGKPNLSDFFPAIRLLDPLGNRRRMSGLMKRLHLIFDRLMAERRLIRKSPGSPRKNDLLDALLDQQEEDKEHGPTDLDMKRIFVVLQPSSTF